MTGKTAVGLWTLDAADHETCSDRRRSYALRHFIVSENRPEPRWWVWIKHLTSAGTLLDRGDEMTDVNYYKAFYFYVFHFKKHDFISTTETCDFTTPHLTDLYKVSLNRWDYWHALLIKSTEDCIFIKDRVHLFTFKIKNKIGFKFCILLRWCFINSKSYVTDTEITLFWITLIQCINVKICTDK